MNKNCLRILFFVLATGYLFSCDVEDCISTKSNGLVVEYIHHQSNASKKFPMIIKHLQAEGNDSILINDSTVLLKNMLYLNPSADFSTYDYLIKPYEYDTLSENPLVVDTIYSADTPHFISIKYTRRQRIISKDCGVEQSFYNLEIIDHDFDSAFVVSDTIDRYIPVNVQIYF